MIRFLKAKELAALATLLWAASSSALVMESVPLRELTRRADVVVHGRVVGRTAHSGGPSGNAREIWTTTTLELVETFKGASVANRIAFEQFGGTLDGRTQVIPGDATLEVGEEVIVFLSHNAGGYYLYGFSQGKFTVAFDPVAGEAMVTRDLSHAGLVTRSGEPVATYAPARLSDFRAELLSYVGR